MVLDTKDDISFKYIQVHHHVKCMILSVQKKNTLYEFHEADKLARDLSVYITPEQIERVKVYMEANCPQVKFSKPNEPGQLSMF